MAKKYDIVATVDTYTDRNGETKRKYQNVGVVMQGDKGPYILLERWFNPSGLPNPDDRTSVILGLYEPTPRQGSVPGQNTMMNDQQVNDMVDGPVADDDIPF